MLVAIAVLAVVLGAIGAVVGNTVRAIRSVDRRLPLLETAQSLIASLPARDALQPGTQSGTSGEFRWRIDAVLLNRNVPDDAQGARSGCRLRSPCGCRAAKARRCGSTPCA